MSNHVLYRWDGRALEPAERGHEAEPPLQAADSFLVRDGRVFALELHRRRFRVAVQPSGGRDAAPGLDLEGFWDAALARIPERGDWFPRVELRAREHSPGLLFLLRPAPARSRAAVLADLDRPDPRRVPAVKGPDLQELVRARSAARRRGADDAVLRIPEGYVVDATTSALVWWRGDILCAPPLAEEAPEFARVDSVTARGLFGLAAALGVETYRERATPAELDGAEVWALSALHGIRIVTRWQRGPTMAELPGRLELWRERYDALRKPIGVAAT